MKNQENKPRMTKQEAQAKYDQLIKNMNKTSADGRKTDIIFIAIGIGLFVIASILFSSEISFRVGRIEFVSYDSIVFGWILRIVGIGVALFGAFTFFISFKKSKIDRDLVVYKRDEAKGIRASNPQEADALEQEADELESILDVLKGGIVHGNSIVNNFGNSFLGYYN